MKKCIVLILSILMILPLILTANAAEETQEITKYEAQKLVSEAYLFNYRVRHNYMNPDYTTNNHIELTHKDLSANPDAELYDLDEEVWYYEVNEENLPGGSYEAMQKYAKTIYTDSIAPEAYANAFRFMYLRDSAWREYPLFYKTKNGKLYANPGKAQSYFDLLPNGSHVAGMDYIDQAAYVENIELEITYSDSKSATATVTFRYSAADGDPNPVGKAECKFEKTDNGWRIAESDFSLLMTVGVSRGSPDTGDNSINSIVIFSTLAVTALISATILLKKRRYE